MEFEFDEKYMEFLDYMNEKSSILKSVLKKRSPEYEIKCPMIPNTIGLIKGFNISRCYSCTCPIQTLAIFVSDKEISFKEKIVEMFNDVRHEDEFKTFYNENIDDLPAIYQSNVNGLQVKSVDTEGVIKAVIFKNEKNKHSEDIRPVCWIEFKDTYQDTLEIDLDSNYFVGKYVLLKAISAFEGEGEYNNIDIQYCSFYGELLNEEEILLL